MSTAPSIPTPGTMRRTSPAAGRLDTASLVLAGVVAAGFVGVFFRWFWRQHRFSANNPADWGHAWVIPLVCVYLLWQRREDLARARARAFWPGLAPMVLGLYGYFFFIVGVPNHMLQGFSMVLALFGVVLLLAGPSVMSVVFLPIAYLVFAVTLSQQVMAQLTFKLQMIAAQGAYVFLKMVGAVAGFDATIEGQTIRMIDSSGTLLSPMAVGQACSGMRTVIAFVALGAAVAILGCRLWWQRVALLMLSVPVAVLLNVARVAVLGLLSLANPNFTSGEAHTLIGTLLLIPGLGLFVLVMWALNRAVAGDPERPGAAAHAPAPAVAGRGSRAAFVTAAVVLGVTASGLSAAIRAYGYFLDKREIHPRSGLTFQALPIETERWKRIGADHVESAEAEEELGTKNYVSRVYLEKEAPPGGRRRRLDLHAAYYTGMIDTVPHVPDRCFLGGGMVQGKAPVTLPLGLDPGLMLPLDRTLDPTLAERLQKRDEVYLEARLPTLFQHGRPRRVLLPRNPGQLRIRVTEFVTEGGDRLFAGYFFIANGGAVERAEHVRLLAFNLTDYYAYYAKVQFTSAEVESAQELADTAADLLYDLLPEIMYCLPDWLDVESGAWPPDNPMAAPQRAAQDAPPNRR